MAIVVDGDGGWLPGQKLVVKFRADPGFWHERLLIYPCHGSNATRRGSWFILTGDGDFYVENVGDWRSCELMARRLAGDALYLPLPPKVRGNVVRFATDPSDAEFRRFVTDSVAIHKDEAAKGPARRRALSTRYAD